MYDYKNYRCSAAILNIVHIGVWGGRIVLYASFFNSGHLNDVMDQDNNKKNLGIIIWFLCFGSCDLYFVFFCPHYK